MTYPAPTTTTFTHVAESPWWMSIEPSGAGREIDAAGFIRIDRAPDWMLAEFGGGQMLTTGTLLPMPFAAGRYEVTVQVDAGSVAVYVPEPSFMFFAALIAAVGRVRK